LRRCLWELGGSGTFENDTACDFAAEVADGHDLAKIVSALDRVLAPGPTYLEAPDAEEALAAAEIVARLRGNFGLQTAYTEEIDTWVKDCKLAVSDDLANRGPPDGQPRPYSAIRTARSLGRIGRGGLMEIRRRRCTTPPRLKP